LANSEFFRRLRRLIGRRCRYLGQECTLIEVLADEAALVLRCDERLPPIQTDQFGQALRRASETCHVPVFGDDQENLSEDMLELLTQLEAPSGSAGAAATG